MTKARSFWIGNRRRDAKVRLEIIADLVKSPVPVPGATEEPPGTRTTPPQRSRKQAPPRATGSESGGDDHDQAVALRRTPRQYIYEWLVRRNAFGGTDEEIQTALQLDPGTARARRGELVRLKLVVDSGIKRKTRSGRLARVWLAANAADAPASNP